MIMLFGRACIDDEILDDVLVTLDASQILDVRVAARPPADADRTTGVITPGFIDVHVHGGAGADFMDADAAAVARVLAFHATEGTTALAATTLSASRSDLRDAIDVLARVSRSTPPGAEICGIHL